MKHRTIFIRRNLALPRLLLRAFFLGVFLTESLALMVGFGLPMALAQSLPTERSQQLHNGTRLKGEQGKPDLFIQQSHLSGNHFQVGDNVTFIIVVGNTSHAGPTISAITVSDAVPAGMRNLRASGHNWDLLVSDTKSPAVVHAKYLGRNSVKGGDILPVITISGKLTKDAIPHLTNVANVNTACDCDMGNNKATDTIFVEKSGHDQDCNQCNEKNAHEECKGGVCNNKSDHTTLAENSATNTPVVPSTSTIAISAVAVASANVNNVFPGVMGSIPGIGGVGCTPGIGGAGCAPGMPNTGSNPGANALP